MTQLRIFAAIKKAPAPQFALIAPATPREIFKLFYSTYTMAAIFPCHEKLRKFHINYIIKCGLRLFFPASFLFLRSNGEEAMIFSTVGRRLSSLATTRGDEARERKKNDACTFAEKEPNFDRKKIARIKNRWFFVQHQRAVSRNLRFFISLIKFNSWQERWVPSTSAIHGIISRC